MILLPVSQKRMATFFFLGFSSFMTAPAPSTCGGGAGGGCSDDVLSATLLTVGFDDWRARPLMSVEGKGGMLVVSLRGVEVLLWVKELGGLLRGRVEDRLVSLESEVVPCALRPERMRSVMDGESGEVFFIDIRGNTSGKCFWVKESVVED